MGVTGASGFPCCGKESVDIIDTQRSNLPQYLFESQLAQEEDEMELEAELLEHEASASKVDPDMDLDPELEADLEIKPEFTVPLPKPEPTLDTELELNSCDEASEQQIYDLCNLKSDYSGHLGPMEEKQVSNNYRSIHVQTSKHLFWAEKHIQVSEHSIERAIGLEPSKTITAILTSSCMDQKSVAKDTLCSKKQLQSSSNPGALSSRSSQTLLSSPCLSSSHLPSAIGLADLINFASSLVMASSSKDLPNLEHLVKTSSQKAMELSTEPTKKPADQPTREELKLEKSPEVPPKKPSEKPLEAGEPQKVWKKEDRTFPGACLGFTKPGVKRTTIEGEVKFLQPPALAPQPQGNRKESPQKPRRRLPRDPGEQQMDRVQKGRLQLLTPMEPTTVARAIGAGQPTQRARNFKGFMTTNPVQPNPSMRPQSSTDENLLPLTPEQLAAFQDIFKLLSSSPAGTVDMRSMKAALSQVSIQLSPQEMCEALRQADLDGDGTVNFKDFLGVLTDNHRFAQCLGRVKNSRLFDPQGLQTLLFEILLKLLSQGAVPSKSVQEVMSYYSKKQRGLQLNPSYRGQPRSRPPHVRTGISFYCQAARVSGLSSAQLARSLNKLHKEGARSPYSQIPNLTLRTRSERKTRNRAPRPEFPLPQPYQTSRPKGQVILGPISLRFSEQPLECWRSLKLPPSPPTLVQKQPFSPPPASLQRPAVKNVYK